MALVADTGTEQVATACRISRSARLGPGAVNSRRGRARSGWGLVLVGAASVHVQAETGGGAWALETSLRNFVPHRGSADRPPPGGKLIRAISITFARA